jgi:hypothetical protein
VWGENLVWGENIVWSETALSAKGGVQ